MELSRFNFLPSTTRVRRSGDGGFAQQDALVPRTAGDRRPARLIPFQRLPSLLSGGWPTAPTHHDDLVPTGPATDRRG
uniref:Uncharacterized protein n=2 Tax=Aegilops tauschii subsp. strangulata TaxID=200361 RepID=A0A453S382_AEGTS